MLQLVRAYNQLILNKGTFQMTIPPGKRWDLSLNPRREPSVCPVAELARGHEAN